MSPKGKAKKQALNNEAKVVIQVVGPQALQNELMASFLEKETGLKCATGPDPAHVPLMLDKEEARPDLVLWDCTGVDINELWSGLGERADPDNSGCFFALFNLSTEQKIEKAALHRGVRGIFRENDPMEFFPKGVLAILKGELWFSRETLAECVLETKNSSNFFSDILLTLTPREKEILVKLASGSANEEIADNLGISPHTVKTHVYNLYQKIGVPNRLQAALWAAKNL